MVTSYCAILVVLAGCLGPQLDITLSGEGQGSVTSTPEDIDCGDVCAVIVDPDTDILLVPTPATGSVFAGWTGGACSELAPCTVRLATDTVIDARFEISIEDLEIAVVGPGNVRSDDGAIDCGEDCVESYSFGTTVVLTATEDPGSRFVGWSGACATSTPTCTLTLDRERDATATFEPRVLHSLQVTRSGAGAGAVTSTPGGINCGGDCSEAIDAGTVVTLVATPTAGSMFAGWTGGGCASANPCTTTIAAATTIDAAFEPSFATFFTIRDTDRMLRRIDPVTLVATDVGQLDVPYAYGDCAWNPLDSSLYIVDGSKFLAHNLYRVDALTGDATLVGSHGIRQLMSLAFHPPTSALYGIGGENGYESLYRLDLSTGAATRIGATNIPGSSVDGLAYDSARNRLVALTANIFGAKLYRIDVATGAATEIGASPGINNHGFAYNPADDLHYAADVDGNLFRYDPDTNFARTTATTGLGYDTCLAHRP